MKDVVGEVVMMTERNPCLTCEWKRKPYWSIVSPCASCPHKKSAQTYTSTTTTLTNGANLTYNFGKNTGDVFTTEDKSPEFVKDLPTAEEYQKSLSQPIFDEEWSAPKYLCPKCGEGGMRRNEIVVLASYPPKRMYRCDRCGHIDYQGG